MKLHRDVLMSHSLKRHRSRMGLLERFDVRCTSIQKKF
jgi:hypothetical protein